MNRRSFLKGATVTSAAVVAGGYGFWSSIAVHDEPLTLDFALAKLDKLLAQPLQNLQKQGAWNLFQMFTHLAQSVEFSMTGYPEHKSELFKQTVGSVAFSAFQSKKQMAHNLGEVIPGAPELLQEGDIQAAAQRFRQSLVDFARFEQPLHPHFAYGPLTKVQYEAAHVMHFNNHLKEVHMG